MWIFIKEEKEKAGLQRIFYRYKCSTCDTTSLFARRQTAEASEGCNMCRCLRRAAERPTRFVTMFDNMKGRCLRPNHPDYKNYGARGITICDEWLNDPKKFFAWCIEQNPDPKLTIERRNNDLGYSPENCFFATRTEQNRNRRNAFLVEYNGEQMLSSEAARASGMDPVTLRNRIKNYPDRPEIWFAKNISLKGGDRKSKKYLDSKQENTTGE